MANYANLEGTITTYIKTNGVQGITGQILQNVLKTMVESLGETYQFAGMATTSTNPNNPDENLIYLASAAGTYTNFKDSSNNALVVNSGEVALLVGSGTTWAKQSTGIATAAELSQLGQKVDELAFQSNPTEDRSYINSSGAITGGASYKRTDYLPISMFAGVLYVVKLTSGASGRYFALYDSNKDVVFVANAPTGDFETIDITEVAESYPTAVYCILSCNLNTAPGNAYFLTQTESDIQDIEDDITNLEGRVSDVEDGLSANEALIDVTKIWANGNPAVFRFNERYALGTGTLITGGSYYTTPFFELASLSGLKLSYTLASGASANGITLFNSSKAYVANVQSVENVSIKSLITTYPTAKYIRISCTSANLSTFKVYQSNEALDERLAVVEQAVSLGEIPTQKAAKIFRRVGCIGDSYTAGYIQLVTPPLPNNTYPLWSWPHYMKQLTGEVWENWGKGGSTAKGWVEGAANLNLVQAEGNECQAYIIGLGINDKNSSNPYYTPVGVIGDIGTDNDTYYAYYYKLVKAVVAVNPDAKIFCNTCPKSKTDSDYLPYNQAVRDIVDYCHDTENLNVYLCDLADDKYNNSQIFANEIFTRELINGHYTPIGYEFMAECMMYVISDVVNENYSEMMNVFEVPYDNPE